MISQELGGTAYQLTRFVNAFGLILQGCFRSLPLHAPSHHHFSLFCNATETVYDASATPLLQSVVTKSDEPIGTG